MKIIVNREELSEAVMNLSRAAMAKSTAEVMEGILFSAEDGKLNMYAYNLEMGITKTLYVQTEENGDIVLNARLFGDILRKLSGTIVTISVDERLRCHIESENTKFDIIGMKAEDFPEMPSFTDGIDFTMGGDALRDVIRQTVFSAATTETMKPVFTGLYFDIKDNLLEVVAVDGFRIAVRREKVMAANNVDFIVSAKSVNEAAKIITDKTEDVKISVGSTHVCFNIDGYTLIARLLEGNFMNYRSSIKDTFLSCVKVNVREIIDIIERMSLIISESMKKPIRFHIEQDKIDFSCVTSVGRADDSCRAQVDGDNMELGINNKYFLDALRAAETDEIILKLNGPVSPIIIAPAEGEDFLYMIMPMLLNSGEKDND